MEINKNISRLERKITQLNNVVHVLYSHLVPDWRRALDARRLAEKTMAKKNRKKEKPGHHKVAGALMKMTPRCMKSWKQQQQQQQHRGTALRPKNNTPEKANWDKMRRDVRISIANFEAKIAAVARKQAVEQLENLNIY